MSGVCEPRSRDRQATPSAISVYRITAPQTSVGVMLISP